MSCWGQKGVHPPRRTVARLEIASVKRDRDDTAAGRNLVEPDHGVFKPVSVTGQPAGYEHTRRQIGTQPTGQLRAVRKTAVAQHKHMDQVRPVQTPGKFGTALLALARVCNVRGGTGHTGFVQRHRREHQPVFQNLGADNFARGRTDQHVRSRKFPPKRVESGRVFQLPPTSEYQDELRRTALQRAAPRHPTALVLPTAFFDLHGT